MSQFLSAVKSLKMKVVRRSAVMLLATAAAVAVLGGVATAQTADWASTVAAAKKEGRVALYIAAPSAVAERIVAGFKKAYPDIAIEFLRQNSGPLLSRIDQERQGGADGGDVVVTTDLLWARGLAKSNSLLDATGPALAAWPADYIEGKSIVVTGLESYVIAYNKNLVPNPPKSYADLLKPEYKGKFGLVGLQAGTTLVAWYDWLEKTQGADFLAKLKAQDPKFYASTIVMSQANASGELPISAFMNSSSMTPLIAQGAPVAFSSPAPAQGIRYMSVALGWSKRPNAARVLLDYIMSKDGQTAWHGQGDSASPLPGVQGSLAPSNIAPWDPEKFPPDVVQKFTARWEQIFK